MSTLTLTVEGNSTNVQGTVFLVKKAIQVTLGRVFWNEKAYSGDGWG